jgi:hypothetical protein
MELLGRETELDDGQWYTLPRDKSWEEAEAAGIKLKMLALGKDDFVLALFPGPNPSGQVFAIGLAMPQAQLDAVRSHIPEGTEVTLDIPERFTFIDRYNITWQLVLPGDEFQMYGDSAGRWLEL